MTARRMNDTHDDDWSTLGGESIATAESSFVNVTNPNIQTNQNEHDKQIALTMQVTPQNSKIGLLSGRNTTKICVTVKAVIDSLAEASRAAVDLVIVLDRSGSMAGDKMKDCKNTVDLVCHHLTSRDRLGLVSFSYDTRLDFPACYMTPENKEKLKLKVKALKAGGGTNLSGGLSLGAMEMAQIDKPNQIRSIFLLTDGHANHGIRDTAGLVSMAKNFNPDYDLPTINEMALDYDDENRQQQLSQQQGNSATAAPFAGNIPQRIVIRNTKPISVFCFGYGGSHNSKMLQEISDATPGGAYYFVEKDSDVSTAFGDAMGGLLSVVAQSACVTISVPPATSVHTESAGLQQEGVKILNVFHKEATKRSDTCYTVNIGDFYAEESRDVLLEIQLSSNNNNYNNTNDNGIPHIKATLNYMDTINKRSAAFGPVECLIQRPSSAEVSPPNEHVELQWLRIQTAQAIDEANAQAERHDLNGARSRLQSAMAAITTSPAYNITSPMIYAMQTDVKDVLNGFRSAEQYRSVGSHCAQNKMAYMQKQRCMESSFSSPNSYRVASKARMARSFAAASSSRRNPQQQQHLNQQQQTQVTPTSNSPPTTTTMTTSQTNQQQGEPPNSMEDMTGARWQKEKSLMFIRVLIKYLEEKDPDMHQEAKLIIKDCAERKQRQEPGYESVIGVAAMKDRLRRLVGAVYWKRAERYLQHFLENYKKREETSTSSAATDNNNNNNNNPIA